ncbi:MAG: SpoIIE family protein phosphatase [Planctomycetes bacterium]|nr:SpoIIE family protein phosphatase [Planctomycetota bacterium]
MPPRTVELTQPIVTIGRSVDNVLEVPDPNMSRRHCVIEVRESGEVILTDCNSSNGTKVNGERIVSLELRPGDEIECGSTRMRFAASLAELDRLGAARAGNGGRAGARAASDTHLDPGSADPGAAPAAATSVHARPTGTARQPAPKEAALLAHERDDLRKLLEITKRLNQVHDLRRLLETIIDAAIELMAAERGFLILFSGGEPKIEIARSRSHTNIPEAQSVVSTQVCRQVFDQNQPVLTTNAQADDRFGRYKSVVGLNLRSIMCVPFRIKNEIFGTVYLDAAHVGAFSERDVELLEAFSDQAALAIENARLFKADRQRERMDQELRIASQIQRKLLPRKLPQTPGIEIYGTMHSAKEVGGDYYDVVLAPDKKHLFFCMGDVSGKGVPAGLVMASARSILRTLVERVGSTREIVRSLNRLLCEDLDQEMFLSFVLMRYDVATGAIEYTGAGHENILIWRAATREVETIKTGGMVLGITTRMDDAVKAQSLGLGVNDAIVLYTDGATEAVNEQNEQFSLERLVDSVRRSGHLPPKHALQGILGDLLRFKGRAAPRDDITLLVVRRTDPSAPPSVDSPPTMRWNDEVTRPHGPQQGGGGGLADWSFMDNSSSSASDRG